MDALLLLRFITILIHDREVEVEKIHENDSSHLRLFLGAPSLAQPLRRVLQMLIGEQR